MKNKKLSIGTVVLLKEAKKRLMVIGYYPSSMKDGEEVTYDYTGCLFPEGIVNPTKALVFNHEDVDKVYFYGLMDDEQVEFIDKMEKVVEELKKELEQTETQGVDLNNNNINNVNANGNFTVINNS